jgi:XTP/dITP diphosphohydrolase
VGPAADSPAGAAAATAVVLATRNRGKVREILDLFEREGIQWHLLSIDDIAPDMELREDEATFEGNALAKARQASRSTGLPALADDSGLEVDALGGAPGVWSARYAGSPSDDRRNNEKLLGALADVADGRRTARYRCVAAYVDAGRALELFRAGSCEGEILRAPRGEGGFGYDPLFQVPSLGRTMAELDLEEKNRLSHRGAAFRALARELRARVGSSTPEPT